MKRPILVTGFGAFLNVSDNPSARLARQVHGCFVADSIVVGQVLPVTYRGGPGQAVRLARALDARLVVGLGVARSRDGVEVERVGTRACQGTPDVEGLSCTDLGPGPDRVEATLDVERLASALGARVSENAGGYVCNAWAWRVPLELDVPAAFVHIPPEGLAADRLIQGLADLLT